MFTAGAQRKAGRRVSFTQREMPQLSSCDRDFLLKLTSTIEANISNHQFTIADLAEAAHLSRIQLTRKLRLPETLLPT